MKLECVWTPDCQGKWDYDADLVKLSTRYWPENYSRDNRPSAKASIMMQEETIFEKEFSADTEADVKALVEQWAQQKFDEITSNIKEMFSKNIS